MSTFFEMIGNFTTLGRGGSTWELRTLLKIITKILWGEQPA